MDTPSEVENTTLRTPAARIASQHRGHGREFSSRPLLFTRTTYKALPRADGPAAVIAATSA